jgi:hypothetical protein
MADFVVPRGLDRLGWLMAGQALEWRAEALGLDEYGSLERSIASGRRADLGTT